MVKVILICGKICSGKSYYTERLRIKNNAVVLSCDEVEETIFNKQLGENHDKIILNIKCYLLNKSVDITKVGCNVILDWGFWSKLERDTTTAFFNSHGIEIQWHYIDIDDSSWKVNITERNKKVNNGTADDYYVDQELINKVLSNFEVPKKEDMDVWYYNCRL